MAMRLCSTASSSSAPARSVDLTPDIKPNYDYFTSGPGYSALE